MVGPIPQGDHEQQYNSKVSKAPICIALYHEQLASKAFRYGTC